MVPYRQLRQLPRTQDLKGHNPASLSPHKQASSLCEGSPHLRLALPAEASWAERGTHRRRCYYNCCNCCQRQKGGSAWRLLLARGRRSFPRAFFPKLIGREGAQVRSKKASQRPCAGFCLPQIVQLPSFSLLNRFYLSSLKRQPNKINSMPNFWIWLINEKGKFLGSLHGLIHIFESMQILPVGATGFAYQRGPTFSLLINNQNMQNHVFHTSILNTCASPDKQLNSWHEK